MLDGGFLMTVFSIQDDAIRSACDHMGSKKVEEVQSNGSNTITPNDIVCAFKAKRINDDIERDEYDS